MSWWKRKQEEPRWLTGVPETPLVKQADREQSAEEKAEAEAKARRDYIVAQELNVTVAWYRACMEGRIKTAVAPSPAAFLEQAMSTGEVAGISKEMKAHSVEAAA
jgi:hypothetical protein